MITPVDSPRAAPALSAALERRLSDLEAAVGRLASGGDLADRLTALEERITAMGVQLSHIQAVAEVAGPGMGDKPGAQIVPRENAPRRTTAVDAYAEGLRSELRTRAILALERSTRESERADKAAALAVEAEMLGAPKDGTSDRLRGGSAQGAAQRLGLSRLLEEADLYATPDLPVAQQLLSRLEEMSSPDFATALEPLAQAVVRAAKAGELEQRQSWVSRAANLCAWSLVVPEAGAAFDPAWHQAIDGGGGSIAQVMCAGLRRADGSGIVRARVMTSGGASETPAPPAVEPATVVEEQPRTDAWSLAISEPPPMESQAAWSPAEAAPASALVPDLAPAPAVVPDLAPAPALVPQPEPEPAVAPAVEALPAPAEAAAEPIPLPAPTAASVDPAAVPFGDLTGDGAIRPDEAEAASKLHPRIVEEDAARSDLGLQAEVAKTVGENPQWKSAGAETVEEDDVEEVELLTHEIPDVEPPPES